MMFFCTSILTGSVWGHCTKEDNPWQTKDYHTELLLLLLSPRSQLLGNVYTRLVMKAMGQQQGHSLLPACYWFVDYPG